MQSRRFAFFSPPSKVRHVNGQVFHQRAGELSLYGHMRPVRMVHRQGGWTPKRWPRSASGTRRRNSAARRRPGRASGLPME
jgi:hypothetical protein